MAPRIGLLVSGSEALADYNLFVASLELWHPDAELFVFTDSETRVTRMPKHGKLFVKQTALDAYKGRRRMEMEAMSGRTYDSMFKDYTYEKAAVLEWMFDVLADNKDGVWFMDADIIHCAPLPVIPEGKKVALSPHAIRTVDEAKFGHYNAGYMWFQDKSLLDVWRTAGHTSRFYEQAALEHVALEAKDQLYEFHSSVNFGWWRMFQSPLSPPDQQKKFSVFRAEPGIGLRYDGVALQSIHTHWYQRDHSATHAFNDWFLHSLSILKVHKPTQQFLRILQSAVK
jgi:hypothetical protein